MGLRLFYGKAIEQPAQLPAADGAVIKPEPIVLPVEDRQALGLLLSIALSSCRIRASYSITI
jgi:hypothetical protein